MVSLTKSMRVAISGLSLLLCMFATFYFLVILKTELVYVHFFYLPIVLVSGWWGRKGVIVTFSLVLFLLTCNLYFAPDISIVDNLASLERTTILLFVGILTSTMFEHRKRTGEKLRFLKEFNERVVDSIGDALLVIDPNDYTIISANETALRQLKLRREDLIGKTCYETTHHRSTPCKPLHHICPIQEMLKTGKVVTVEHTHFDKDNNEIYLEFSAHPVRDHEGNLVQAVYIARDTTERKKAEEELVRLSSAVKMSTDSIVVSDLDGKIIDVNGATLKMYGTDDKEGLIGKNSFDLIAPEDREKALAGMKKALEKGYVKGREYRIITKDGNRIPVEMSVAIMKGADGKPIGFVGISRDISERKQIEETLRESEEKFRSMVETTSDWIWEVDKNGVYTYASPKIKDILGYEPKEIIGKTPFDLMPKDEAKKIAKIFEENTRKKKPFSGLENWNVHKNGTKVLLETSGIPILDEKGQLKGYRGIDRDITERKRMEKELRKYTGHLEELVKERTWELEESQEQLLKSERLAAIGGVAAMVGHDLRNPLQSIENATYCPNNELLHLSSSAQISQKAMEMIQILNDSVDYADKIIRDLQDFSATKKPILKKTNINAIVKETLSQVGAPENVGLITELGRLPEIEVDKDMVKRVFLNLALNGTQAIEKRGTLEVSTKKTKRFVEVSFKDTGIGMSKEKMEKLFTPFFTTKAKGMGMGLAICKRFVESHNGSIEVESEEGKGSTFTVKLPI